MGALQEQTPDVDKSSLLAASATLVAVRTLREHVFSRRMPSKVENMDGQSLDLQESKEEVLISRVSDESIEAAAAILKERVGSFTLSFCSGLDTCPS